MPHHHFSCEALQLTHPSVKLDLVGVLINAKYRVTGIPDACTFPGDLLTWNRINMHIADSLSCLKKKKKAPASVPNDT